MARTKSPKYPNYPLSSAIENVRKVYNADRTTPLPREVIAKHLGYSGISGASDAAIATIVQYGLLERTGKAEMKVSKLAVDILVPENDEQKQRAINTAALKPPLFADVWNHFEQRIPSPEALRTYLLRREFHDRAIDPVMRSFEPTMAMMKQQTETGSGGPDESDREESSPLELQRTATTKASVGDYVHWESQGVLQFKEPKRVRWVSDDGEWLAVDGSDTGIPMSDIQIQKSPIPAPPPAHPGVDKQNNIDRGFSEWFRAKVGPDKLITINYKGDDEIGPREIDKMIKILEAQKAALED
ncbi:MAG: hypothetical protein JJ911_03020 [Rhizobiaceae bacterium]|nr:hypothetical protein [Rhizobiaceae bacterium]